jgi:ABC-type transport system involved in multi-copper enzyme maturation permease subunit
MTASDAGLTRRTGGSGFGPLLGKELRTWWGGRRWLFQAILWQFVINGLLLMVLFVLPNVAPADAGMAEDPVANGLQGFFSIGSLALAVGVIMLAGDALSAEIQSGTAEWLLTKPIARSAFVLAKLAAHAVGMLVVLIALPGIVAFVLLSMAGELDAAGFAAGLAVLALHTFFYLALVLMLGALTRNRTAVIGIALAAALGGQLLFSLAAMLPVAPVALLTPWPLAAVATALAQGAALPAEMWLPVAATAAWSAVFIAVALWRFERLEL